MALASIPVPPDAKRDAKARELLATAFHLWHLGELKQTWGAFDPGTTYFITLNGYRVNTVFCDCKDYKRGHICKHVRCVVLAEERATAKPRLAYEDIVPAECWERGCTKEIVKGEGACAEHMLCDAF